MGATPGSTGVRFIPLEPSLSLEPRNVHVGRVEAIAHQGRGRPLRFQAQHPGPLSRLTRLAYAALALPRVGGRSTALPPSPGAASPSPPACRQLPLLAGRVVAAYHPQAGKCVREYAEAGWGSGGGGQTRREPRSPRPGPKRVDPAFGVARLSLSTSPSMLRSCCGTSAPRRRIIAHAGRLTSEPSIVRYGGLAGGTTVFGLQP